MSILFLLACLAGTAYLCAYAWRHAGTAGPGRVARRLAIVWGVLTVVSWYTEGLGPFLILGGGTVAAATVAHGLRNRPARPAWWNGQHERIDQA